MKKSGRKKSRLWFDLIIENDQKWLNFSGLLFVLMDFEDHLMQKAFDEARKALDIGEVPIGSIFYDCKTKNCVS